MLLFVFTLSQDGISTTKDVTLIKRKFKPTYLRISPHILKTKYETNQTVFYFNNCPVNNWHIKCNSIVAFLFPGPIHFLRQLNNIKILLR